MQEKWDCSTSVSRDSCLRTTNLHPHLSNRDKHSDTLQCADNHFYISDLEVEVLTPICRFHCWASSSLLSFISYYVTKLLLYKRCLHAVEHSGHPRFHEIPLIFLTYCPETALLGGFLNEVVAYRLDGRSTFPNWRVIATILHQPFQALNHHSYSQG
jgi:hypothetical protein